MVFSTQILLSVTVLNANGLRGDFSYKPLAF